MHDDLAAIGLPQYADLLFGRGSFTFHGLGSLWGRRLTLHLAQFSGPAQQLDLVNFSRRFFSGRKY
jgi:hypothetical protein